MITRNTLNNCLPLSECLMGSDYTLFKFIRDTFPISTIALVVILSAWVKTFIVCSVILKFQERRIKFLEEQLEKLN